MIWAADIKVVIALKFLNIVKECFLWVKILFTF
jgi:hypothetical protein